jgi:hypothetical protein
MSTAHANDFAVHETGFTGIVQSSAASAHQASASDDCYMSRSTRKVVYMFLLGGVVFLASVAAYVWTGFFQWQNLP